MVDAAAIAPFQGRWENVVARSAAEGVFTATTHASADRFLAACAGLEQFAPAQSQLWVSTWLQTIQPDAILVTVKRDGKTVFGFGLQTLRKGTFKIARVLGLTHANSNFFPLSSSLPPSSDRQCMELAIEAVRKARPDVHALVFERLAPERNGRANPILSLPSQPSPNIALALDISEGFEAVLAAVNGQRKRKRQRYLARKLGALGTVRFLRAKTRDEVHQVINAFFEMKAARFRKMGVADTFGDDRVRAFFRTVFEKSADSDAPSFVLDALEVGDKVRAIAGSSVDGERLVCDFAGFADDETASYSPGDYLLHENIRQAASDGFAIYDLGVGDEPYKRSWCGLETRHYDVFVALTTVGKVLVAAQRARTRVVSAIKANETAWRMAKAVRGIAKRGRTRTTSTEDET